MNLPLFFITHLLKDFLVDSSLGGLWIKLLLAFSSNHRFLLLLGKYVRMGLLGHMVIVRLTWKGSTVFQSGCSILHLYKQCSIWYCQFVFSHYKRHLVVLHCSFNLLLPNDWCVSVHLYTSWFATSIFFVGDFSL